jgi:response regulator RpfG family c-di-GMP phosphodiesterase
MVDILSLTNPAAFSRCMRIKNYVQQIVAALAIHDAWQYEVAAMLSQIGFVTIPAETIDKIGAGEALNESEHSMLQKHPEVAANLIGKIPRLECVAQMIANQNRSFSDLGGEEAHEEPAVLGASILKAANDFDTLVFRGASTEQAVLELQGKNGTYNPDIVRTLNDVSPPVVEEAVKRIAVSQLRNGMTLAAEARTRNGVLIAAKGQVVNDVLRRCLMNLLSQEKIDEAIRVHVSG